MRETEIIPATAADCDRARGARPARRCRRCSTASSSPTTHCRGRPLPDDRPAGERRLEACRREPVRSCREGRDPARRPAVDDSRRRLRMGGPFLDGVGAACESYNLPLLGGDTIALPEGSTRLFGMTAIGRAAHVPGVTAARPATLSGSSGRSATPRRARPAAARTASAAGPLVEIYRRPVPQLARRPACWPRMPPRRWTFPTVSCSTRCGWRRPAAASPRSISMRCRCRDAFSRSVERDLKARMFAATGGDDYALLAALPHDFDPETLSLPRGTTISASASSRLGDRRSG